jgi:hypothetical protein
MILSNNTISAVIFWTTMLVAQALGILIFKDLADISQWVIQGPRETTMAVWYNRMAISTISFIALLIASAVWFRTKVGPGKKGFAALLMVFSFCWFSGMINPHIMMRPRQTESVFVGIEEAKKYVDARESVIVYEIDGTARAHADVQVLRPHIAGGEAVNGKEVVMTYCGLTNLGIAYSPVIDGQKLDLAPMTQLENNLVMFDRISGEPIQQLWGQTEADVKAGIDRGMLEHPTFRMPFEKFEEAYPHGEVFINDYLVEDMRNSFWSNPPLFAYDRVMEFIFNTAIDLQQTREAPVFPTISHFDERLPTKTHIWGFDINNDYVAYTEQFIRDNNNLVNTNVGGQDVVIAFSEAYQSLGVYYNHTGRDIRNVDFFGMTENGTRLARLESVKAGAYWIVWANFFPHTDLNRA